MAVALVGRHGHKVAAPVAMGAIYAIGQTFGILCLWQAYRTNLAPASRDL
jgi:hypothetical protein